MPDQNALQAPMPAFPVLPAVKIAELEQSLKQEQFGQGQPIFPLQCIGDQRRCQTGARIQKTISI